MVTGFSDWSKLIRYDGLEAYIYGVSNSRAYATHFATLTECHDITDGFLITGFLHGLQANTGLGSLFPYVRNPPFPEAVCDQQFLQALFDLLPQGPAFPRQAGTNQPKLLTALADYLCDEQDRFQHLLIDAFPSSTVELLGEWEKSLGLPDKCMPGPLTIAQREAAVICRLVGIGGQSISYLNSIAEALGFYGVVFEEFTPYTVGMCARSCVCNEKWAHTLNIKSYNPSVFGFDISVLICELQRVRPAQSVIVNMAVICVPNPDHPNAGEE